MQTGRAERILPGGEALVRNAQGACLVPDAVPGDCIRYAVTGKRRGAWRGRMIEVVEASEDRVAPICTVAETCGGCALACLDPGRHGRIKSAWVREAFDPWLDTACDWHPIDSAPGPGQRRRVRLWRGEDRSGSWLGFRARASHRVVRAPACPAIHPFIEAVRLTLGPRLPAAVTSVRVTVLTHGAHVVLETASGASLKIPAGLRDAMERLGRMQASQGAVAWWMGQGMRLAPLIRPAPKVCERVPAGCATMDLVVGPEDFVQGTIEGHAAMIRQVQDWAADALTGRSRPGRVADLFCGIGNLSLPLARATGCSVRGADMAGGAIRRANAMAREHGLDARYQTQDLMAPGDLSAFSGADVLILDPPRKGARRICERMGALLPERLIMIHCDPASGRRDANLVAGLGYRLRALRALDLFPWTGHVETMSLWLR